MEKADVSASTRPRCCSQFLRKFTNRTSKVLLLGLVVLVLIIAKFGGPSFNAGNLFQPLGNIMKGQEVVACVDITQETPKPTQQDHTVIGTDVRRRLASTLVEVYREITRQTGHQQSVIDTKLAIKLAAVAEELDPRISLSMQTPREYSATFTNVTSIISLPNKSRHVCPEVYKPTFDPLGQVGMESEDCNYVPNFNKVLTVILPATSWTPERVNFVVKQIRKRYNITIVPIVMSKNAIDTNVPNLRIVMMENGVNESTVMNQLFKTIETPFVLMGTSLAHFNNQSSLERLVRVLDEVEHVKVVGGAARDPEGLWNHGCLQQRMAVYEAHYALGYYYSKYECMYCDDLLTPFVTSVALLKQIPFQEGLNGHPMYRDWFAKLRVNGILSMACPDVMFYVQTHPNMDEQQWIIVAKQWSLEKITSYDDKVYVFDCSSVGIYCLGPLGTIASFQLAPCCRALMTKYLAYLTDYGNQNNLHYELHAGSVLGALKMNGYLPWDYDHDISIFCKDFSTWRNTNSMLKRKQCYNYVTKHNVYLTVNCPGYFLELVCHQHNASSYQFLPPEYTDKPTLIKYAGKDIAVRPNPGLYARNRYGFEWLKHESHWRTLKNGPANLKKGHHEIEFWRSCKDPQHHSCLDHYPIDGNLPFQKPFLNL
ncbi:uncharacterized protein LOC135212102 [Macrobrachium nipponense]|uniref:uncharacterized protein LOC135212102 n=1 Tax=Macrobrachium nipponense TaxID=159736 RepID=UPI0030C8644C